MPPTRSPPRAPARIAARGGSAPRSTVAAAVRRRLSRASHDHLARLEPHDVVGDRAGARAVRDEQHGGAGIRHPAHGAPQPASVSASSAALGSSSATTSRARAGAGRSARATATRCACPPESPAPWTPSSGRRVDVVGAGERQRLAHERARRGRGRRATTFSCTVPAMSPGCCPAHASQVDGGEVADVPPAEASPRRRSRRRRAGRRTRSTCRRRSAPRAG